MMFNIICNLYNYFVNIYYKIMSYLLNISSDNKDTGQFSDDFTINFTPAIRIAGNWELALVNATMWYSWYNISADYSNQPFRYFNNAVWKTITIAPGLY